MPTSRRGADPPETDGNVGESGGNASLAMLEEAKKNNPITNILSPVDSRVATTPVITPGQAMASAGTTPAASPTANTAPAALAPAAVSGTGTTATGQQAPPAADTPAADTVPEWLKSSYAAETLPGASDKSDYINELYDARQKAALAALEAEYQKSTAALDKEAAAIPAYYYEAARQAAGLAAREKQAMNQGFAASGLNTGAAGQAAIAQSNVMQSEQNAIRQAEAQALADIEADRTALALQYQAEIRQAILNNETEKAQALYEEAVRVDDSLVSTALNQASLNAQAQSRQLEALKAQAEMMAGIGDFSGYAALGYSADQIAALEAAYQASKTPATVSYGSGGVSSTADTTAMDYDGLFRAAQASGYPAAFLAQKANYEKYGFSSSSGLASAYEDWLASGGGSGDTSADSPEVDIASVMALGYGPISAARLSELVASGEVEEYVENGKLKFRKVTNTGAGNTGVGAISLLPTFR